MTLAFTLFIAGVLTILLPCILPLIPIVLGVSIAGRSKWRPLLTVLGMLVSFVGFTFLLQVVLSQFVEAADYLRIATYYVLLLFGIGFLSHSRWLQILVALAGSLFFLSKGWLVVALAAVLGVIAVEVAGRVASRIQQWGSNLQQKTRSEFGDDAPVTAFIMGLTMGLVWVPCAGPALGFALTLVRDEPGIAALFYLTAYGLGTALPLLLIGYGGQKAAYSVRVLSRYSGYIKQVSGALLIVTALLFQFGVFKDIEIWFVENTAFGNLGVDIESALFGEGVEEERSRQALEERGDNLPTLPDLGSAPELVGLGSWHNSEPLTLEELRGKVVLVDFWTYSCINCIRTLPYLRQYWDKYQDTPFVLLGVHTPEFVFEKSESNVAAAIDRHDLTYPIAQDNDYGTWKAFDNHYWPAKYLIDAEGNIRYVHFGEGDYDETDLAIQSLLAEIGVEVDEMAVVENPDTSGNRRRSPETYLGERSWQAFQNVDGRPTEDVMTYVLPEEIRNDHYALEGMWQLVDGEKQVLRSETGTIVMRFTGDEINLVMGQEDFDPARSFLPTATVSVDGEEVQTFGIDRYDLFSLWKGEYGEHVITITIEGAGTEAYAFTFGS